MRILVVNHFGIGDVLFTFPLLRAIKENLPQAYIGYLCNRRTEKIVKNNPDIDQVFVFEKDEYRAMWKVSKLLCAKNIFKLVRSIRKSRFDTAIDLSLSRQFGFGIFLSGAKNRIGFDYKGRGMFLTHKIKIEGYQSFHMVEHYARLLDFLGIKTENLQLKFHIASEDRRWADEFLKSNQVKEGEFLVGIVPGGGASWGRDAAQKRWSTEKFASLADSIVKKHNAKILLLGDKSEQSLCESVKNAMSAKPILGCGRTDLGQFAALLEKCGLVVCNDGGPLHIAVGVGTRTISFFGPVDEKIYGPYPLSENHVVLSRKIPCRPCYKNFKYQKCNTVECLKSITQDEALAVVGEMINGG